MKIIRYTQPVANTCGSKGENFDSLFNGFDSFFAWPQATALNLDSREDKDSFHLRVELPGLKREDLKLSVADQVLTIKGQKKSWKDENAQAGSVERSVSLPDQVDAGKIEAKYEDGVLYVTLPKREEVKPREIEISVK
jgi:HSP20 family protein